VKNLPYGSGLAGGVRNERWYAHNRQNVLDYEKWCHDWAVPLYRVCKPGAPVAVFNSTRTVAHVQIALEKAGFYTRDILVYRRQSGIPKGLNAAAKLRQIGDPSAEDWVGWHSAFRNEWEAIVLVQKPLVRNYLETLQRYGVGLFKTVDESNGGFLSNIIENVRRGAADKVDGHATPKPLALMRHLIDVLVPPGADHVILDPFAGSGTTLVAARSMNRPWVGVEIVPSYIDVIKERLLGIRDAPFELMTMGTASPNNWEASLSRFEPRLQGEAFGDVL
jgi:site-specific DNA-methyltransferase (adenine-specific)